MRIGIIAFTLIGLVLIGGEVSAQQLGRVGLYTGYPAKIGMLWHITERVAIRPGASFRQSSFDPISLSFFGGGSSVNATSSNEYTMVGLRVDALFSLGIWDNVRAYVAPGYEYTRSNSTTVNSVVNTGPFAPPNTTETRETISHDHEVSGTFGTLYVPHRRFGVFGEAGIYYSQSRTPSVGRTSKSRAWGTATGAGVIFYF